MIKPYCGPLYWRADEDNPRLRDCLIYGGVGKKVFETERGERYQIVGIFDGLQNGIVSGFKMNEDWEQVFPGPILLNEKRLNDLLVCPLLKKSYSKIRSENAAKKSPSSLGVGN